MGGWGTPTTTVLRPSDEQLRQIVKGRQLASAVRTFLNSPTTGNQIELTAALARYDANSLEQRHQPDKENRS